MRILRFFLSYLKIVYLWCEHNSIRCHCYIVSFEHVIKRTTLKNGVVRNWAYYLTRWRNNGIDLTVGRIQKKIKLGMLIKLIKNGKKVMKMVKELERMFFSHTHSEMRHYYIMTKRRWWFYGNEQKNKRKEEISVLRLLKLF